MDIFWTATSRGGSRCLTGQTTRGAASCRRLAATCAEHRSSGPSQGREGRLPSKFQPSVNNFKDPGREKNVASVREALQSRGRSPKRWLGQHYMVNDEVVSATVAAAAVQPGDLVLEVGPGTGALTQALRGAGARVLAVEKDPDMVAVLRERFRGDEDVELCHCDVLKWPAERELQRWLALPRNSVCPAEAPAAGSAAPLSPARRVKLVSNLPFNITTDVLRMFLPLGHLLTAVVLMLQDEAAQRLVERQPQSAAYRRINLFVHFFSEPRYHFFVPRKHFVPPPNVDAAVVSFALHHPAQLPHVPSTNKLFLLIDLAFQGKRKMLRNSLQSLYGSSQVEEALEKIGHSTSARPEDLSLRDYVELCRLLEGRQEDSR